MAAENGFRNGPTPVPNPSPVGATQITSLFEDHLRLLRDSYLLFFVERTRIEEQYITSLLKLHRKIRTVDTFLNDRSKLGDLTVRVAWNEIVENVEREAEMHQAFLNSLNRDIVAPLNSFKEEQERVRKRIREDLKEAIAVHDDYRDSNLPSLKRIYLRKAQEAEESRLALSPSSSLPQEPSNLSPMSQTAQLYRSTSVLTTSTALSDLRIQGKKSSSPLRTLLRGGSSIRDGERSDSMLRYLRLKSEAEEADKEYRKGIYWQETLRLRRVKIAEAGSKSLETFVCELSVLSKRLLGGVYLDNLCAMGMTQYQLQEHCRNVVDKIVPERDGAMVAGNLPSLLSEACPKPVFYYNFNVGDCKDLIFGTQLVDYAADRGPLEGDIPKIVRLCIEDVDRRGLDSEGIYWVPGGQSAVQELRYAIERNEGAFALNPRTDDVYAVASFLKAYLQELPMPIFRFPLQERMLYTERIDEHVADNFALLRSRIRRLPSIHQATLRALLEHLARIVSRSDKNKMDPKNLATVFGPLIFGEDEMPDGTGTDLSVQSSKDTLMEDLLMNVHTLFQQGGSSAASLSSETSTSITSGSQDTKSSLSLRESESSPLVPVRSSSPFLATASPPKGPSLPHRPSTLFS